MTPGWITTMTSSQIPQLWYSLRDRVPTSFFTRDAHDPRPTTTGAAASQLTSTPRPRPRPTPRLKLPKGGLVPVLDYLPVVAVPVFCRRIQPS